jgi:hypothetical protein
VEAGLEHLRGITGIVGDDVTEKDTVNIEIFFYQLALGQFDSVTDMVFVFFISSSSSINFYPKPILISILIPLPIRNPLYTKKRIWYNRNLGFFSINDLRYGWWFSRY